MAYVRHDKDNNPVSPQPGSTTVNQFSGNEGWSTVTYKNFNADFQARNADRSARTHLAHFKHVIKIIMQELLQHISVTTKTTIQ